MLPFAIAFTGKSNTGKTTLISQLIEKFAQNGMKVGTIKKCSHGFEIDKEGKDSMRYKNAGSDGVLLISSDELAFLHKKNDKLFDDAVNEYFTDYDIVLIEGHKEQKDLRKFQVLRKGTFEELPPEGEGYIGIIADFEVESKLPVFSIGEIDKIYEFILQLNVKTDQIVRLNVNGKSVGLKYFVQEFIRGMNVGAVESLHLKTDEIREIRLLIKPAKK